MIPCNCIDDANRPNEIPAEKWVTKGEEYHITHVYWHYGQKLQGVDLAERDLEGCMPYATFKLSRFSFKKEHLQQFIELCKACTEMTDFDIKKVIEEELILEEEFA